MEILFEPEQTKAIYLRLLRQEAMLSRILDELERIQLKLSNRSDSETRTIRDRRLRILRTILEDDENVNITQIAKNTEADIKTVRSDLNQLATDGLILYMTGKRESNPGRRGNCPRLTRRGRKMAASAFDLDRENWNELWKEHRPDFNDEDALRLV